MAIKKECPRCRYRNKSTAKKCTRCGRILTGTVTWWVDINFPEGRYVKRIGRDLKEARRHEAEVKARKIRLENYTSSEKPLLKLEDFWPVYISEMKLYNRDISHKISRWEHHLASIFGKKLISEIKKQDVERYKAKRLQEGASPATVNREVALLRHILNVAVDHGLIEVNPLTRIKMFQEEPKGRSLSDEEIHLIARHISPVYKDFFVFLAMTGLREGEALSLTWDQVDLDQGKITIWGYQSKRKERFEVPLHPILVDILRKRWERKDPTEMRVFPHSKATFYKAFKRALKRAGLDTSIRPHDLRHTVITRLMGANAPIQKIQRLVGHKRIETTLRYTHLSADLLRDTVSLLKPIENISPERAHQQIH